MAITAAVKWRLDSQNVANNTSTLTVTVETYSTGGSWNANAPATIKFWYNAASYGTYSITGRINPNTTSVYYTRQITVTHNSDGTARVGCSIDINTQGSSKVQSANGDYEPPQLGRASTFTVSGTKQLGNPLTINISRSSSSFTHNLKYSWGSRSSGIANGVGTSTTWTPSISMADALTNATSSLCTITCDTYSGGSLVGSISQSFTLSIPSSVKPSIDSVTVSDDAGFYEDLGYFVSGKSSLGIESSASGAYGSTITRYSTQFNGITKIGQSVNFGTVSGTGRYWFEVTVTDSRGRTASKEVATVWNTNDAPDISSSYAIRTTSSSSTTESPAGTYIRIFAKGSLKSGSGGTVVFEGKASTASSYTTLSTKTFTGTSIDLNYTWSGRSTEQSWEIQITCTDNNGSTAIKTLVVNSDSPVMDFKYNGKGVAIGKVSEADAFEVGMPADFNSTLNVDGNASFTNPVTLKNTLKVNAASTFAGTSTFNNTASFTRTATFGNSATFNGTANFYGDVNGLELGNKVSVATVYNSGELTVRNSGTTPGFLYPDMIVSAGDNPPTLSSGYIYPPSECKFMVISGTLVVNNQTGGCNMFAGLIKNSSTIVAVGYNTAGGDGLAYKTSTITFPPVYITATSSSYFRIHARINGSIGAVPTKGLQLTMIAFS